MPISIQFGLFDATAKPDSTVTSQDVQAFSRPADLQGSIPAPAHYATLEHNQWLLNGEMEVFPDAPESVHWGAFSRSLAGADGSFNAPVVVDLAFTRVHSSAGLTLQFYGAYPTRLRATWFGAAGNVIDQCTFVPDGLEYFAYRPVVGYKAIRLELISMSAPYRYLKLHGVMYGAQLEYTDPDVVSCSIHEEVDLLSSTVASNTMELTLYSEDKLFSIINPTSVFYLLQQSQALSVYNNGVYYGRYYLDRWESTTEKLATLYCVDAIAVLDHTGGYKGGLYQNTNARALLTEVLAETGLKLQIDDELAWEKLTGWIPYGSRRDALQQVAFALRAVVDCSRTEAIKLYRLMPETWEPQGYTGHMWAGQSPFPTTRPERHKRIPIGHKVSGHTTTLLSQVTRVLVTAHKYIQDPEQRDKQLLKGFMGVGVHTVSFPAPVYGLSMVGCIPLEVGVNYAVVQVDDETLEQEITGTEYLDSTSLYTVDDPTAPVVSEVAVKDATLVSQELAPAIAQHLYEQYGRRYRGEGSIIMDGEACADTVLLYVAPQKNMVAKIESLDLSLGKSTVGKVVLYGTLSN